MNIIKKLGITPGPWTINHHDINYINDPEWFYRVCEVSLHRKYPGNICLIAAAPEMLEALIKSEIMDEKLHGGNDFDNQKIIEKATGKTWEEIKELLE